MPIISITYCTVSCQVGPYIISLFCSEPLSHGSYLVVTKGDANRFAEAWEISVDGTVAVALARVRFAGYVLEFLGSIFGRVLLIAVPMVALIAMWVRRGRIAPSGKV